MTNMIRNKKERVTVTLDAEIIVKVDEGRGLIPRATFINELLKNALVQDGI